MPSATTQLQARKDTILAELAALSSKPDYNIDGQQVSNAAYRKSLLEELKLINELLADEDSPFEFASEGF